MPEYPFLRADFFQKLPPQRPDDIRSEAKQLLELSRDSEEKSQEFLKKQSKALIVLGIAFILFGISFLLPHNDAAIGFFLLLSFYAIPKLVSVLSSQPSRAIEEKLKKFESSLAKDISPVPESSIGFKPSEQDSVIAGILGGLAEATGIPSAFLRAAAIFLTFTSGGIMILVYIALAIMFAVSEKEKK